MVTYQNTIVDALGNATTARSDLPSQRSEVWAIKGKGEMALSIPKAVKRRLSVDGVGRIGFRYLDKLMLVKGKPTSAAVVLCQWKPEMGPLNLMPFHAHYWHKPGSCTGRSFGFFPNGVDIDKDHLKDARTLYQFDYLGSRWYYNAIMVKVESELKRDYSGKKFNIMFRNCQRFIKEVRMLYYRGLEKEVTLHKRQLKVRRTFQTSA